MSAKMVNQTMDTFFVLDTVANSKKGMTVGEVGKLQGALTRGQLLRILAGLVGAGMLYVENVPYGRTGKNVYKMTEYAAIMCSAIARSYGENN